MIDGQMMTMESLETSEELTYVEKLHGDIQTACSKLENIGYQSLVVIATESGHIKMGSIRGKIFLEDSPEFIEEFCLYCRDSVSDNSTEQDLDPVKVVVFNPNKPGVKTDKKDVMEICVQKKQVMESQEHCTDTGLTTETDLENDNDMFEGDSDGDSVISELGNNGSETETNEEYKSRRNIIVIKTEHDPNVEGCVKISSILTEESEDLDNDLKQSADAGDGKKGATRNRRAAKKITKHKVTREHGEKNSRMQEKKSYECDQCDKKYNRMEDLKIHKRKHAGVTPFVCKVCNKGFRSKKMLKTHEPVHSATKPFPCDQCSKQYARKEDLLVHKRKHTGETPFTCEICKKGFISRGQLRNHKATHADKKPHVCIFCDKDYIRHEDLQNHQRIHTGETPYLCVECNKSFRSRGQLRDHRVIHSAKSFACETCGRVFNRKTNLARHQELHSSRIVGTCHTCGKVFRDASALKKHQFRHTAEKPFSCETCGKQFWSSYLLHGHKRIHTGEKPFSCDICGQKFMMKRYMTKHRMRQHRDMLADEMTRMEDGLQEIIMEEGGLEEILKREGEVTIILKN